MIKVHINGTDYYQNDNLGSCIYQTVRPNEYRVDLNNRYDLIGVLGWGGVCAEIGVQRGDYAEQIFSVRCPEEFWLIDSWAEHDFYGGDWVQKVAYQCTKHKFFMYPNVHVVKAYSIRAAQLFDDNYFDFIYIDADHVYENVLADIHAWWPKVKPGGYLAGHDYENELHDTNPPPDPPWDIKRAVDECFGAENLAFKTSPEWESSSWAVMKPPLDN